MGHKLREGCPTIPAPMPGIVEMDPEPTGFIEKAPKKPLTKKAEARIHLNDELKRRAKLPRKKPMTFPLGMALRERRDYKAVLVAIRSSRSQKGRNRISDLEAVKAIERTPRTPTSFISLYDLYRVEIEAEVVRVN